MRVDVVDGQTVALDGGTTILVVTDRRREAMIKWTRALDNVALAELAARARHGPAVTTAGR